MIMAHMRWSLAVLVLAACGSKQPAALGNTGSTTTPAAAPEAAEDCSSSIEDSAPGNHDRFAFESNDLWGYKNAKGAVVIPPTLRHAYEFKPGGVAAAVDGSAKFVFLEPSGNVIAQAYAFDNGPDYFQEGHARIVDANQKIGFINDRGQIAIPPRYDEAGSFCRGKAEVVLAGKPLVIDKRGNPTSAHPADSQ